MIYIGMLDGQRIVIRSEPRRSALLLGCLPPLYTINGKVATLADVLSAIKRMEDQLRK